MAIKVMIADDHPYFRMGIREELKEHKDVEIVYEAKNGAEAIALLEQDRAVNMLLLDLEMPKLSGYEVLEEIRRIAHPVRTIVVSVHSPEDVLHRIVPLGAHGCVPKGDETGGLYRAICTVAAGGTYFPQPSGTKPEATPGLKPQELAIIRCLEREMSSQQIADHLNIGLRSVERLRGDLIQRAGAKNATGLVLYARTRGWL